MVQQRKIGASPLQSQLLLMQYVINIQYLRQNEVMEKLYKKVLPLLSRLNQETGIS
jgi:hypothetical protein